MIEPDGAELRVLGALIEKQRTTPDTYPLSLNALRLACNQSTNRDPVVEYDESTIRDALHRLERRGFTRLASGAGSRTAKYRHLLAEALPMDSAQQAVMCVLMLSGPQPPGELKQRTERMHPFGDLAAVHQTLDHLIARELAVRLERRPGHKEERYAQLLQDGQGHEQPSQPQPPALIDHSDGSLQASQPRIETVSTSSAPPAAAADPDELAELRGRIERLERQVDDMAEALGLSPAS